MKKMEENLLSDYGTSLVRASTGKRFANYIIDIIFFYIIIFAIFFLWASLAPGSFDETMPDESGSDFLLRIVGLVFYALFMGLQETIFKGRSLGKLITGTRAVNLDGTFISAGKAFTRGFSRAVPFAAFSAFGTPSNPWQDKWTDTMVVDLKGSQFYS